MLKLDWGDAQVWMDTAVMLHARNATDPEKAQRRLPGYPWGNELNVAAVCAGYAFELIFKVLVKARSGRPEPKHEPSEAYRILRDIAPGDCDEIDRIVANHGWNNSSDLLKFLDEQFCDKDRKYWMRPPKGGVARGVFHFSGRKRLDSLKRLHYDISQFALRGINEREDVYEDWPGIHQ